MKEKNVGKPWSKDEDELLLSAVAIHGEVDNWKNVALCVPGRTNKACRKVRNGFNLILRLVTERSCIEMAPFSFSQRQEIRLDA